MLKSKVSAAAAMLLHEYENNGRRKNGSIPRTRTRQKLLSYMSTMFLASRSLMSSIRVYIDIDLAFEDMQGFEADTGRVNWVGTI